MLFLIFLSSLSATPLKEQVDQSAWDNAASGLEATIFHGQHDVMVNPIIFD